MSILNTACGWTDTDPASILIALRVVFSRYTIDQITMCMNDICDYAPETIDLIQSLISEYEDAYAKIVQLNTESNGKTLVKADVLEWEPGKAGEGYSPEREMERIRGDLSVYFGSCPIFNGASYNTGGSAAVIRS